jgi:hypothetical protein
MTGCSASKKVKVQVAVVPPPPRLEIIRPPVSGTALALNNGGARAAAVALPAAPIVGAGLWDSAWTALGAFRNGAAAANFIDLDSGCFHFRVFDADATGNGHVDIQWGTRFTDLAHTVDDALATLRLNEVVGQPGYFISRGVMLVTDAHDRATPHHGGYLNTDERLRRITVSDAHPLTSEVYAEYTPVNLLAAINTSANVFDPAGGQAASRKRLRVHFIDVLAAQGGAHTLTNPRRDSLRAVFQSIYAVAGVFVEIDVTAVDPPPSCTGWPALSTEPESTTDYPIADPSVVASQQALNLVTNLPEFTPSQSELDLAADVANLQGYQANDAYLLFVNALYAGPPVLHTDPIDEVAGGEAFTDAQTEANSQAARGLTFIALNGVPDFSAVHEVTHMTTDFNNVADGHFDLDDQNDPLGALASHNLMHRHNLTVQVDGHDNPKRLWNHRVQNTAWGAGFWNEAQIDAIRASRFVHAY